MPRGLLCPVCLYIIRFYVRLLEDSIAAELQYGLSQPYKTATVGAATSKRSVLRQMGQTPTPQKLVFTYFIL